MQTQPVSRNRDLAGILLGGALLALFSGAGFRGLAAEQSGEAARVAAVVGGESITVEEVRNLVGRALDSSATRRAGLPQTLSAEARGVLEAQALEELVARHLVMAYSRRTGTAIPSAEIDRAAAQLLEKASREISDGPTPSDSQLRRRAAWQLQWDKYLRQYATDVRIRDYFFAHRREFDGTELTVRHILLQPDSQDDPVLQDRLLADASRLRDEILAGEIEFEVAARRHSAGPSAAHDGLLGRIGRHGPMVETFSAAAFALEPGEISPPVPTPFGVHLIRCDAIHPGTQTIDDVWEVLHGALSRELLEKLAALERRYTTVRYSGETAYFRPGTKQLILPETR